MSERMDGWRECADPVELAAAVAVEAVRSTRSDVQTVRFVCFDHATRAVYDSLVGHAG